MICCYTGSTSTRVEISHTCFAVGLHMFIQ